PDGDACGSRGAGASRARQRRCSGKGYRMNARGNIYAVVPVKDTSDAKRRLAGVLHGARRQQLALAMCEDVLATLTGGRALGGTAGGTADPAATAMGARYGARVSSAGAREGHS